MPPEGHAFLIREFTASSMLAAFATRAREWPIYAIDAQPQVREQAKRWFRRELATLVPDYQNESPIEEEHVANIRNLAARASAAHGKALHKGKMRFGVTQKLLNLFVKYLWLSGTASEPCHCPIDGIIRDAVDLNYDWTSSNSEQDYRAAISELRRRAHPKSVARWELAMFNQRRGEL